MKENQEKKTLNAIFDKFLAQNQPLTLTGLAGAPAALAAARLHARFGTPLLMVAPTPREAEALVSDLGFFLGGAADRVRYFPPYNLLPYGALSYHNETAAARIRLLYWLTQGGAPPIVVTTPAGALQRVIPRGVLVDFQDVLLPHADVDRDDLIRKLIAGGYSRTAIVEEPGDFSARGGVIDFFSPYHDQPLRVELMGDWVETLRFFSPATQRTTGMAAEAVILPARETVLDPKDLEAVIGRVREQAHGDGLPVTGVRELVDRIRDDGAHAGLAALLPLIYPEPGTLMDYMPVGAVPALVSPARLRQAAQALAERAAEKAAEARAAGRTCAAPERLFLGWEEFEERVSAGALLRLEDGPAAGAPVHFSLSDSSELIMALQAARASGEPMRPLVEQIRSGVAAGETVMLTAAGMNSAERLSEILSPHGIRPPIVEGAVGVQGEGGRGGGRALIRVGTLSGGFVWPEERLRVIAEAEIFGVRKKSRPRRPARVSLELLDFADLKQGDLVVHSDHGIGRYEGLVKLKLDGFTGDFLNLAYRDDDRLYLPVDRMSAIQKYMGVEGFAPVLDKLGGKTWERVQGKVKKSVRRIAGELLKIYAARRVEEGHAFADPDAMFDGFVTDFPYEETTDQRKVIDEVIADMASPAPMDRLVCGDVGYGKTEVALRAAFVAVSDSRQVAVLVPTTVLAEQHYATFAERFGRYAARVECLSRFRSGREQREIIEGLKSGAVDIVIGTHRLLQADVSFQSLGLIILDEEQRFGVRHKEKLKKLRATVDVLALTATPIPRTLHMSLMGIRDISVIATPPEDRRPIITYICEPDDAIITDAIRGELRRGGQIFFVHNHVAGIDAVAARLNRLVPEVRLAVAHGQMAEDDLEAAMLRFSRREIDMLVCTTIIESGLDVATANTILVNRADRFGLSQIYQLRGRVGRSDEQAYAYLFIPNESVVSADAKKRLKVLMEHSDLGSGFQIAMNDLKIRGGGSILGASQSGHIAAVGYDMFLRLMENAVSEMKGEPAPGDLDPEINVGMSAFLAEDYIPDIDQRLTAYRRLARMRDLKAIADYKAELIDRFGPLPPEAANLLMKIMLKVLAIRCGIRRLDLTDGQLQLRFSEAHQKNPLAVAEMAMAEPDRFRFAPDHLVRVDMGEAGAKSPMGAAKNILKEIAQRVNI